MDPEIISDDEKWDGVDQREIRRRYTVDRRKSEKRKRYWWSVIFPILLGGALSALISWGVYVTHVTYRISANYEETFVKYIAQQLEKETALDHRLELMRNDYTNRMNAIRLEMTAGIDRIRSVQDAMYRILLEYKRDKIEAEENEAHE